MLGENLGCPKRIRGCWEKIGGVRRELGVPGEIERISEKH